MKRIRRKLNSRKGASITFALLLFLVCAVLSSVIIVAATAASGRMSRIAESDQRYYAVTSAAELLIDALKKHPTVSVVKVVETTYITTYKEKEEPSTDPSPTKVTSVYVIADKKAAEISDSDLTSTNKIDDPSFSIDTIQKDAAKKVYDGTGLLNRGLSLKSNFYNGAGLGFDALAVAVSENLDTEGNIKLTLYNKYNQKGEASVAGSQYTLVLSFGADKNVTTNTKTEHVSYEPIDDSSYKETTRKTETIITTLTWTLNGIKTNA